MSTWHAPNVFGRCDDGYTYTLLLLQHALAKLRDEHVRAPTVSPAEYVLWTINLLADLAICILCPASGDLGQVAILVGGDCNALLVGISEFRGSNLHAMRSTAGQMMHTCMQTEVLRGMMQRSSGAV
eukprot:1236414-Pleurochrysis_carterae.AAC.2